MIVRIEGVDLPGTTCEQHTDVHVGVQRGREVVEQVRGDAPSATWSLEVTTKRGADGGMDFGGPYVHGRRGERFLYLSWGEGSGDAFTMFRRAKIMLADAPVTDGTAVARVTLTDSCGMPTCARVRPPLIAWSVA